MSRANWAGHGRNCRVNLTRHPLGFDASLGGARAPTGARIHAHRAAPDVGRWRPPTPHPVMLVALLAFSAGALTSLAVLRAAVRRSVAAQVVEELSDRR